MSQRYREPRKRLTNGSALSVRERIRREYENPFSRLAFANLDFLTQEEQAAFRELFPESVPRPEPTLEELAAEHEEDLRACAFGQARGCIGPSSVPEFQAEIDAWAEAHPEEIEAAVKPCRDPQGSKVIHVVHGDEK